MIGKRYAGWLAALWLASCAVQAQTVRITAFYEPDPQNPMNTSFKNTTPQAAFCQRWPQHCRGVNAFTVGLPISYTKTVERNATDVRSRYFIGLPSQRNFQITSLATGAQYPVQLSFTHVSQMGRAFNGVYNRHPLNTTSVGGGCRYQQAFYYANLPSDVYFVWSVNTPQAPSGCISQSNEGETGFINSLRMSDFGMGFELRLPPPLELPNGRYRAQQVFTVGPGMDFDLGNGVSGQGLSEITLDFDLAVNHHLKTEFPPGSHRAVLEPKGGWSQWIYQGRPPTLLQRDIPFRVWASGPFRMYVSCQYLDAGHCAMLRQGMPAVLAPVEVALTLPAHIQALAGGVIRNRVLPVGQANALALRTVNAAFSEPATLQMRTTGEAVNRMLEYPGSLFEGVVVVHFEPEL